MNTNTEITLTTGNRHIEVFGLEAVTPDVFDNILACEAIICPDGDLGNPYYVSWVDKGCDEDGVYYKGFCCRLCSMFGRGGHYEALWFNNKTFREVVGRFIKAGGDWVTPDYYDRMRRLCA